MELPNEQENQTFLFTSSQEAPPSSPLVPSSGRQRKPPSVTPRRFTRFFNPRFGRPSSDAGRELRDITRNAANIRSSTAFHDLPDLQSHKRRRFSPSDFVPTDLLTPPASSPPGEVVDDVKNGLKERKLYVNEAVVYPRPIRRAKKLHVYPTMDNFTADFWSTALDMHDTGMNDDSSLGLPFCVTSCNTNSLVASGDENGLVRILDSDADNEPTYFTETHLRFKPHNNAIMDMAFSQDDKLLGTASGDQSARIIDMRTQTTLLVLNEHKSSLKQIAFQPGNDDIVATCSRDGTVNIWDLRCENRRPSAVLGSSLDSEQVDIDGIPVATPRHGMAINSIIGSYYPQSYPRENGSRNNPPTPSTPFGRTCASMTSMTFISASRPHLLVTATDSNSQVRLWDIRHRVRQRSRASTVGTVPVSTSAPIPSHASYRHWGISSLVISADAARLYAVCRDSAIYAYSTSHLALGSASSVFAETEVSAPARRPRASAAEGALPLYALRNPGFHASTFYVRAAIRKPRADRPELLAVGSGDPNPVVFPTDETLLRKSPLAPTPRNLPVMPVVSSPPATPPVPARRGAALPDPFPVYTAGTCLLKAHERDVTGVCWTEAGDLVSISDDYIVRLWRERPGLMQSFQGEKEFVERPAAFLRSINPEWRKIAPDAFGSGRADAQDNWDDSDG